MKSGEFSGHSIDEAVFHGLMELGLSIDEVQIETLQSESKGIFGIGAKMARVRLTERDPAERETQLEREAEQMRGNADHRPERGRQDDRHRDNNRQRGDRPQRNDGPQRGDRHQRDDRHQRSSGPRDDRHMGADKRYRASEQEDAMPPAPHYDYQKAVAEEHASGQFLSGLLEKMDIEADVLAVETEDGIRLRIDSATKGLLIGRRGETLDALQYITSLTVNRDRKQDKYIRITIDTEDYRAKREDTLRKLARRQASRVKATGRSIAMEPMNPYERRVLHASLQGHPYVTTHSEGEEPNRRVIITPK